MAAERAKSYRITRNSGSSDIWRGGRKVGTFPNAGYNVQVFGCGSGLAGTLIGAHALAETMRGISPYQRRYVLTEAELAEDERVMREWREALLAKYPFTSEEAEAVAESDARHAGAISKGRENMRAALLNSDPYKGGFAHWNPNPKKRPEIEEPEPEPPPAFAP